MAKGSRGGKTGSSAKYTKEDFARIKDKRLRKRFESLYVGRDKPKVEDIGAEVDILPFH